MIATHFLFDFLDGAVVEWSGTALQKLSRWFESSRHLNIKNIQI